MTDRIALNGESVSPIGSLPIGWDLVRLVDITTKIGSGATPKGGEKVYLNKRINHALVRSQHVFDRRFESGGLAYITADDAYGLRNAELQSGDILLNITGDGVTFGRACLVPDSILPACVNQHVSIIRVNKSQCLPGFLVSYLTHPTVKDYIESFNAGGSRRAITKGHIESFEIPLPPLSTQERIADILGTLDDKIELNRWMNETLEAMARRLFKSWFVDFDPVHAKAALRREHPKLSNADLSRRALPNMTPEIAELFPDNFEDSKLGTIPAGWRATTWAEIATLEYGKSLSGYQNSAGNFRVYGTNGPIGWHTEPLCKNAGIIVGRKGAYRGIHLSPHPFFVIDTAFYLNPKVAFDLRWAYFELLSIDINSMDSGSAIPSTSREDFNSIPVLLPPPLILKAFGSLILDGEEMATRHQRESKTLRRIQGDLLPRLLSGEIL